jgi:hypothetical protein
VGSQFIVSFFSKSKAFYSKNSKKYGTIKYLKKTFSEKVAKNTIKKVIKKPKKGGKIS